MSGSSRTVIITGGAHGIGLACARRFGKAGDNVVLADINTEHGRYAEDALKSAGYEALFVHADVSERLDIHNLMAQTLDAYDGVDILINNAAVTAPNPFLDVTEDEFDKVIRVNLKGPFLMSQAVARVMIDQVGEDHEEGVSRHSSGGYNIINISSVQAVTATADRAAYSASKGGLNQLTKSLSLALARYGIRVNAIGPGAINTDADKGYVDDSKARARVLSRTPLGRIGAPEEVAAVAYFLASPDASYITGQCIYADGGRLALNYLAQPSE